MVDIRPFNTLGAANFGWLDAHHHFSFGHYYDASRMGWGALRVWNDDTIDAQTGFDPHPHRDMEIITYVRKGAITHQDRLGNEGRTEAGDIQVMHAGTGIVHAEYNLEPDETQIFQIWIEPGKRGAEPGWAQREFNDVGRNAFKVLASGRDRDQGSDALPIYQDAAVIGGRFDEGRETTYTVEPGRLAYMVANEGILTVNGEKATARDGIAISSGETVTIKAETPVELVLVDVPEHA
ncbi:MAG: pirin family protein [Alphaproteobacteria bacterium]|nr:pirin family protein [Alphaproteobacteria bacterium]